MDSVVEHLGCQLGLCKLGSEERRLNRHCLSLLLSTQIPEYNTELEPQSENTTQLKVMNIAEHIPGCL